jgi:hypothetical protein
MPLAPTMARGFLGCVAGMTLQLLLVNPDALNQLNLPWITLNRIILNRLTLTGITPCCFYQPLIARNRAALITRA